MLLSYAQRAKYFSSFMHEEMERPMDRAISWIEYVVHHKGAPHLRLKTQNLRKLERTSVDVILVLFCAFLLLLYGSWRVVYYIFEKSFSKQHRRKNVLKSKNKML